jgi:hypothetical protein
MSQTTKRTTVPPPLEERPRPGERPIFDHAPEHVEHSPCAKTPQTCAHGVFMAIDVLER